MCALAVLYQDNIETYVYTGIRLPFMSRSVHHIVEKGRVEGANSRSVLPTVAVSIIIYVKLCSHADFLLLATACTNLLYSCTLLVINSCRAELTHAQYYAFYSMLKLLVTKILFKLVK